MSSGADEINCTLTHIVSQSLNPRVISFWRFLSIPRSEFFWQNGWTELRLIYFVKLKNPASDLRCTFDWQLSPIYHLSPQYPHCPSLGSDRVYFALGPGSNGHSLSALAVKWGEGWYPEEIDFIQGKISAPLHHSLQDWVQTPEVMIDNPHADWKLVKSLTLQRCALFSPESFFNWRLSGWLRWSKTPARHAKLWSPLCSTKCFIFLCKKKRMHRM